MPPPAIIMLPRKINSTDAAGEAPLSCTSQKPDTSDDAHPFYLVTDAEKKDVLPCGVVALALTFFYNQIFFKARIQAARASTSLYFLLVVLVLSQFSQFCMSLALWHNFIPLRFSKILDFKNLGFSNFLDFQSS